MKVLFYSTYFTSHTGGVERFLCDIANWMTARGHEIAVITEDQKGRPLYDYPDVSQILRCKLRSNESADLENFRFQVESYAPDVFVFTSSSHTLARKAWRALRGLETRFVISEHGPPETIYEHHSRFLRDVNSACADGIHVLLPDFARDLNFVNGNKIVDIQHVIEPPRKLAQPSRPIRGRFRLINVGRVDLYQKRQDLLIKAFGIVADEFPDWDLAIAGSFWSERDEKTVRAAIAANGLDERVFMLGPVDTIGEELANSHIFVFPSAFEGLPLALSEALAAGLPAIGFRDCEGTNFLINHGANGLLVEDELGAAGFAAALRTLMSDENTRIAYGKMAQTVVKDKSPDKIFGQWELFLSGVAEGPSALCGYHSLEHVLRVLGGSKQAIELLLSNREILKKLSM